MYLYFVLLVNLVSLFRYGVSEALAEGAKLQLSSEAFNGTGNYTYLPLIRLAEQGSDSSEFWLITELLHLMSNTDSNVEYEMCKVKQNNYVVRFPSRRTIRPICRTRIDFQLCPQCPHFTNRSECELFRESCRESRVPRSQYLTYCDKKYGKWQMMFMPADYSKCRCCDECIPYRELDQSCQTDEMNFDMDESLPVTTIDFRAGCNPYMGHPDQELKALRCDKILRRCVPISVPLVGQDVITITSRRNYRYQPPSDMSECPVNCRGYICQHSSVHERECADGAFLPDNKQCNCCGRCSNFQQLNEKCAEYKRTIQDANGTQEIEVEEEFLEPGCDDGLVCRQGICQDIHSLEVYSSRRKRRSSDPPYEPCKREMKLFKKKYGNDGHLHYEAPQCTPLWLYAPVQCRRFICYCALEDGSMIHGIKVPRVEVSNMNCDCAREKCRGNTALECDGYGNYKEASFYVTEDNNTKTN